jgi:hypothetical protein
MDRVCSCWVDSDLAALADEVGCNPFLAPSGFGEPAVVHLACGSLFKQYVYKLITSDIILSILHPQLSFESGFLCCCSLASSSFRR